MKSINTPFMYLHTCARTSVEYLHDDMSKAVIVPVQLLLSSAAQLQICEYHTEMHHSLKLHPWVIWMLESVEHYSWCVAYYESLCEKSQKLFYKEIEAWRFVKALKECLHAFPESCWIDPPLPDDMSEALQIREDTTYLSYRDYYLIHHVKIGCYRRVEMPFWIAKRYKTAIVPPEKALKDTDSAYVDSLIRD